MYHFEFVSKETRAPVKSRLTHSSIMKRTDLYRGNYEREKEKQSENITFSIFFENTS